MAWPVAALDGGDLGSPAVAFFAGFGSSAWRARLPPPTPTWPARMVPARPASKVAVRVRRPAQVESDRVGSRIPRSAAPAANAGRSSRLPPAPAGAAGARPARAGGRHIGPGPRRMRRRNRRRPPRPSPRSAATTPRAAAAPTAPPWPLAGAGSTAHRRGPDARVRGRRYHAGVAPRPRAARWPAGAGRPGRDSTGKENEGPRGASVAFARLAHGTKPGPRARPGWPSLAGEPCGGGRPAAAWRGLLYPAARTPVGSRLSRRSNPGRSPTRLVLVLSPN